MLKTHFSWLVSVVLLIVSISHPASAQQAEMQSPTTEAIKAKVAKLGVGEKAKATIRLKDGGKVKGYVARADEDDFVIRDRKTDAPTTIRYADVAKVESNKGHSTARNITIGVAIGAGALLAGLLIAFSRLD